MNGAVYSYIINEWPKDVYEPEHVERQHVAYILEKTIEDTNNNSC